jgi:prepilin-type N-terminal cleavage/methylation domain-containing protein
VRGFTLIELLVVIGIIGILIALMLPAVQQVRETARGLQCRASIKQLALALHSYADAHGQIPPAAVFSGPPSRLPRSRRGFTVYSGRDTGWGATWVTMVLPWLEQAPVAGEYDSRMPSAASANWTAVSSPLDAFHCPTQPRTTVSGSADSSREPAAPYSKITYGLNCGPDSVNDPLAYYNTQERGVGNTAMMWGADFRDMRDGTTTTVLLGELVVSENKDDCRGCWGMAMGATVAGYGGDWSLANGFDSLMTPNKDPDIWGSQYRDRTPYCGNSLRGNRRCRDRAGGCLIQYFDIAHGVRSDHPGVATIALCDGSARSVSDSIEAGTWYALLTSANATGGEPLVTGF